MNAHDHNKTAEGPLREAYLPTDPPPPPVSGRNQPKFSGADHRKRSASAFEKGAREYDEIRPGYPRAVLDLVNLDAGLIADVGCGTGKLTEAMVGPSRQVVGIDPSMDMLNVLGSRLGIPAWCATAEATGLRSHSCELVTCAQTWHWVDPAEACAEFDRITTATGHVLLVWNTLNVAIPWVHRLSRIMHSGDTLKEGFIPEVHAPWTIEKTLRLTWNQSLQAHQLHDLTHTRSYWLRSNERTRAKVTANLNWYLYEHLGYQPSQEVQLPYRADAFLLSKV